MSDIIKDLQMQVYKLDYKIGNEANNLGLDLLTNNQLTRPKGNIDWYNECIHKRAVILECIEKLKEVNI